MKSVKDKDRRIKLIDNITEPHLFLFIQIKPLVEYPLSLALTNIAFCKNMYFYIKMTTILY